MGQFETNNFLFSLHRYYGKFSPEALMFNANLQEFAFRVSLISNFQTSGKLSEEQAYQQINELWQKLELSYTVLGIGKDAEE